MLTRFKLNGLVNNSSMNVLGAGNLFTTGKVTYVNSATGNNGNVGDDPIFPKATIAGAQTASTASVGDVVAIAPGHSETLTAVLTLSKAGVSYVGLGAGLARPTLTINGAIDGVDITGANVSFSNVQFPAPGTDDQTADINVTGAGVSIFNTYHIGSTTSKNKTDIITVATGGNDLIVDGVNAYNTVVDCVSFLSLEAAVARPIIRNCNIQGTFSTAALMDEATATLALIENNLFKNTKAATAVVTFTTGNTTGVMRFNHISGRHTTLASNVVTGTGMDFFENRVTEEASLNGAISPAADTD